MRRVTLFAAAVIVVAGCRTLPDIATGECGNGVVDLGEDCDRVSGFPDQEGTACGAETSRTDPAAEQARSCRLVCIDDAVCPEDWMCGGDGICRQPSGQFEEAVGSPWPFLADDFAVGDVDGDGKLDLIGTTRSTVSVLFGDNGAFPDSLTANAPGQTGAPTFADLNGDGLLDVVLPFATGISTLVGSVERTLEPVVFAPNALGTEDAVVVPMGVSNDFSALRPGLLAIQAGQMGFIDGDPTPVDLPGEKKLADIQGRVAHGDLTAGSNPVSTGREIFGLAFSGDTKIYFYGSLGSLDPPSPALPDLRPVAGPVIDLPAGCEIDPIGRGLRFVDVDGVNGLDLVVEVEKCLAGVVGEKQTLVAFKTSASAPTFSAFSKLSVTVVGNPSRTIDHVLAVADLSGDGRPDFVTKRGIYLTCIPSQSAGPCPGPALGNLPDDEVYWLGVGPDLALWDEAVVGDFNRDGLLDVAVTAPPGHGIQVFLNAGTGLFTRFMVDARGPGRGLRVGDFDGDQVDDVAFVFDFSELLVAFGAESGGPSDAVSMGNLPGIRSMESAFVAGSNVGPDAISDLVVVTGETQFAAAVLQGTTTRSMISPYTLDDAGNPVSVDRTLVGDFVGNDQDPDVLVIGTPLVASSGGEDLGELTLYPIPGIGQGQLLAVNGEDVRVELGGDSSCLRWGAAPITGGPKDDLVAIDGSNSNGCAQRQTTSFAVIDLEMPDTPTFVDLENADQSGFNAGLGGVTSIAIYDADGNGSNELIAVFEGGSGIAAGVAVYWNKGGNLTSSISPLDGTDIRPVAAAPVQQDDGDFPELIMLGSTAVWESPLRPEDSQYDPPEELFPFIGGRKLELGDVNGDGLQDLVILRTGQVSVYLAVPKAPCGDRGEDEQC